MYADVGIAVIEYDVLLLLLMMMMMMCNDLMCTYKLIPTLGSRTAKEQNSGHFSLAHGTRVIVTQRWVVCVYDYVRFRS